MFYSAKVEIDPSQITIIKKLDQDSVWSKFAGMLTFGNDNQRQEQETFTVISILNQIQMGLMRMNVDDVVKVSVDEFDYFFDKNSADHDLHIAMEKLEKSIDSVESERFNIINLVLEHKDSALKYVIDLKIKRKHPVGEYPIVIKVNGLIRDLMLGENETLDQLKNRMAARFSSQEVYKSELQKAEDAFQQFVRDLESNLSKFIRVDGMRINVYRKVPRPRTDHEISTTIANPKSPEPAFVGYPGIEKYLRYSMIWGAMCSDNALMCSDFTLVDEHGFDILTFGKMEFKASETGVLNPNSKFDIPIGIDAKAHKEHNYKQELASLNLISLDEDEDKMETTDFSDFKYQIID